MCVVSDRLRGADVDQVPEVDVDPKPGTSVGRVLGGADADQNLGPMWDRAWPTVTLFMADRYTIHGRPLHYSWPYTIHDRPLHYSWPTVTLFMGSRSRSLGIGLGRHLLNDRYYVGEVLFVVRQRVLCAKD